MSREAPSKCGVPAFGVDQQGGAFLVVDLHAATEDGRRLTAAISELHRVDASVVLRDRHRTSVESREGVLVDDAPAAHASGDGGRRVGRRLHRVEEDVLIVQVGVPPNRRRAVRVVDQLERCVRQTRPLSRCEGVCSGDTRDLLRSQEAGNVAARGRYTATPTTSAAPAASTASSASTAISGCGICGCGRDGLEHGAKVRVVLNHAPRDELLWLRLGR